MNNLILRHSTHVKRLSSIVEDNGLCSSSNLRSKDNGFLSFELNPPTDFLKENIYLLKVNWTSWKQDDTFPLEFDVEKIYQSGITIHDSTTSGLGITEVVDFKIFIESSFNSITWPSTVDPNHFTEINSENILELVGEYRFIQGFLSLDYLTDQSRSLLEQFMNQ